MPARLTIETPGEVPRDLEIGDTATIGRTSSSDIVLAGDGMVSRQHAVIRCQNGAVFQVIDLGSKNGTYVDDRLVVLPTPLQNNSKIRVGKSLLTLHFPEVETSPEVLDRTLADTNSGRGVEEIEASMLVCDIRGFSTISEHLPAAEVARFIGKWFLRVGEIVERHYGHVDKFMGDAVLAYWPGPADFSCGNAMAAGLAMLEHATKISWPGTSEPVRTALALHHGRVSRSNVGLVAQRDATIMGNAVNTVFRLETAMKPLGAEILCSEVFYRNLSQEPLAGGFEDFGEIHLKGQSRPIRAMGLRAA